MFFKKLVDEINDKIKFDIRPKKNEEFLSVAYGCMRFIDIYRLLSSSLDALVKTLLDNKNKTLKNLKKNADNDGISKIVIELVEADETIEGLKKIVLIKLNN